MSSLFLQQLFESETSTFTYLLADLDKKEALLIDPVLETVERDLHLIRELEVNLKYILETHIHADHITGAARISEATGAKIAVSEAAGAQGNHLNLRDGQTLNFGRFEIRAIACPGHTNSCMCYFTDGKVFTGDALMIRTNGRTDFQEGSAEKLYHNIHEKIFSLPEDTLVYPAHDYKGFTSSTIGLEKRFNTRLGGGRSLAEFVQIMKNLNLPQPKKIQVAVPANLLCGKVNK